MGGVRERNVPGRFQLLFAFGGTECLSIWSALQLDVIRNERVVCFVFGGRW